MITPIFEVSQSDVFVEFIIKAPFAKISDAEIAIEGREFFFSSKPYFLRLYLPEELIENGSESAVYDVDSGSFTVKVSKKIEGQHFSGLNLITKLLTSPSKNVSAAPLIEILEPNQSDDFEQENSSDEWSFEQKINSETPSCSQNNYYGFASQRQGVFTKLREDLWNLIDIDDPDSLSIEERSNLSFENEQLKFSDDHYLADFFDSDQINEILKFVCPWEKISPDQNELKFNEKEILRLKDLPKKIQSLDPTASRTAALSLVDILFAYAFNFRTTEGENNVESAWLVTKISPTLSCLIDWIDMKQAITRSVRRSLCFPLHRSWKLSKKVLDDVKIILKLGRTAILKCFLDIHEIFSTAGDYRYILNELYITDYCVWLQHAKNDVFERLAEDFSKITVEKNDVQLDLDEIELAGKLAKMEIYKKKLISNNIETDSVENCSDNCLDSDDSDCSESSDEVHSVNIQEKMKDLKIIEEI